MSREDRTELERARSYFIACYLNTGCDEEEAEDAARQYHSADEFYFEAERYRDM